MSLNAVARQEIQDWTRRNTLVREVYFLEQLLGGRVANAPKRPCMTKSCKRVTKSKSGMCPTHIQAAKNL